MRSWIVALGLALSALLIAPMAQAKDLPAVAPTGACEALANRVFAIGTVPARITAAKAVTPTSGAAYCQVLGYLPPAVRFEIHLPTTGWTQRLVVAGCGGFCGALMIRTPAAAGCAPLERGEFVTASSDLGHNASDGAWASGNEAGLIDYGHRAMHLTTLATKAVIQAYYGQAPRYSYFSGCSDGGREGLMEAQRYPGDFDGIVAGAAVYDDTTNNSIYHGWVVQHLVSRDGKPLLPDATLNALAAEVMNQCDDKDGVKDNILAAPEACKFAPEKLLCAGAAAPTCLTAEQLALVRALYTGPVDSAGKPLYHGAPLGSEKSWNQMAGLGRGLVSNFTTYMTGQPFTGEKSAFDVKFDAASRAVYNRYASDISAMDANLAPFAKKSKLLMWLGWTVAGVPAGSSIRYYKDVRAKLGAAATDAFLRLYMLPAVNHCGGGDGPDQVDLLTPLMAWVEDGVAPGAVPAHKAGANPLNWTIVPYGTGTSKPVR
jgi:feruloyl esterase